jgi:TPR repeat protein
MSSADKDFEQARLYFRKAAEASNIATMRRHALVGLSLLERADALSAVIDAGILRATGIAGSK